jgi:hypothetical protein
VAAQKYRKVNLMILNSGRQLIGVALLMVICIGIYSCEEAPPAHAKGRPPEIRTLNGECGTKSNTAYGPSEADISAPQYATPLRCDAAIFALYPNHPGHVMIDFVQKGVPGTNVIAFGGTIDEDGRGMTVDQVYFATWVPVPAEDVEDSVCRFSQKNGHFDAITCGTAIENNGTRRAAVVNFLAAPSQ